MATLAPPFDRLSAGTTYQVQASMFGWRTVGSCTVSESAPFRFTANGSYDVMGRRGSFDLALVLTDEDRSAASGPCSVTALGQSEPGTYTRSGDAITFEGVGRRVTASPDADNGVLLKIGGFPDVRIVP